MASEPINSDLILIISSLWTAPFLLATCLLLLHDKKCVIATYIMLIVSESTNKAPAECRWPTLGDHPASL